MSQNNPKDVSEEMKLNPVSNLSETDLKENKKAVEEEGEEEEEEEEEEELEEVMKNIKKTSVILRLGDVIVIQAATNEILNNNTFLIEYIDRDKIKIVNAETFDKSQLRINKNGGIGDGSITKINIISSNPNRGYARQHDLITGKWINIYFGGDVPLIITGQITDLEEDMIEVKTMDDETIYINFEYHGIPEDLPIQAFEIRPPPETKGQEEEAEEAEEAEEGEEGEVKEGLKGIDEFENEDFSDEGSEEGEIREVKKKVKGVNEKGNENIQIPVKNIKKNIERLIFKADDVVFGEIMHVQEHVEIDQDKYRFNIETQTNDLLEEMLSSIPSAKRTSNVLNKIHIMISRFIQLRDVSSNFDKNKNVTGFIQKTANDRPLANYLSDFKNNLYWIMLSTKCMVMKGLMILKLYRKILIF